MTAKTVQNVVFALVIASCLGLPRMARAADEERTSADIYEQWRDLTSPLLENRCATALCFGGSTKRKYAFEPILDLPIGKALRLPGAEGLVDIADRSVEGDAVNVSVQAGLRFWLAYDFISVGVLFLNISLKKDIPLGQKTLSASSLTTPAPGLVVGLGADLLQISLFRYVLRNDSSNFNTEERTYGAHEELSSGWMMMFSFAPFTALRTAAPALKK